MKIFSFLKPAIKFIVDVVLLLMWKAGGAFHSQNASVKERRRTIKNLLVLQMNYLGDVLLTLPALYAFKKKFPDARLTMMIRPEFKGILEFQPYLDRVVCSHLGTNKMFGNRLIRDVTDFFSLRKHRFDAVVDVSGRFATAWMAWLFGSPVRAGCVNHTKVAGIAMQDYGWLYTHHVLYGEGMYLVDYHKKVLGISTGVPLSDEGFELSAPDAAVSAAKEMLKKSGVSLEKPVVCIHVGANHKSRRWPDENFARLSDTLVKAFSCDIIFTGSAGDAASIQSVQSMMHEPSFSFAGATTLTELASLVSLCRLFISSFTGPMHLALLLNVPVVGLSCVDDNPRTYFPVRDNSVYIEREPCCGKKYFFFDALRSQTCNDKNCLCMGRIAWEDVVEKARSLLVSGDGKTVSSIKTEQ